MRAFGGRVGRGFAAHTKTGFSEPHLDGRKSSSLGEGPAIFLEVYFRVGWLAGPWRNSESDER